MQFAARQLDAYGPIAGAARSSYQNLDGDQDGLPEVVASAIWQAVHSDDPPLRLVIGSDAHGWISDRVNEELDDLARWQLSKGSASD